MRLICVIIPTNPLTELLNTTTTQKQHPSYFTTTSTLANNLMLLRTLTTLSLERNKIGDRGAVSLSYLLSPSSFITKLFLSENRIADKGACAIAEHLKENKLLHTLELGCNLIGPKGGVALARALKENSQLVVLNLKSNRIGAAGAIELAISLHKSNNAKTSLSTLDISCNNIGDVGGARMQEIAEQDIVGNIILHGNQVGVCTCKQCVLTTNVDPNHWCYKVGKFNAEIIDIDENGGNLTTANNTAEFDDASRSITAQKLVPRDNSGGSSKPRKIGFKAPVQSPMKNPISKTRATAIINKDDSSTSNFLEAQLESIMGQLGGARQEEEVKKHASNNMEEKESTEATGEVEVQNSEITISQQQPLASSQAKGLPQTRKKNLSPSRLLRQPVGEVSNAKVKPLRPKRPGVRDMLLLAAEADDVSKKMRESSLFNC